jgi:UDP-N-acetylmuramyl tripeptide synthase
MSMGVGGIHFDDLGNGVALMLSTVALAAGRCASTLSQVLGKGSGEVIGGRLALRIDPQLLARVGRARRSVLVTGTNGKSTVTALVAAALRASGRVVTNATGANMPDGIVTVMASDHTSELAAIEVDEVYLRPVVDALEPQVIIALNAFREYTRGVSLAATLEHWRDVADHLPTNSVVLANVDDPLTMWAFEGAPRVVGVAGALGWQVDAALCPACGREHQWSAGGWSCPGCGRRRPEPAWRVETQLSDGEWLIDHPDGSDAVRVSVPGRTAPIGAAFALAAGVEMGIDVGAAARAVSRVVDVDGRYFPFPVRGRSARLLMLKNPAGWTEAIDVAVTSRSPFVIAVDPFGPRDTTTMWEAPFGRLSGRSLPVTGGRAADVLAVLEAAQVAGVEFPDASDAIAAATSEGSAEEVIVACNYPAFRRLSKHFRTSML